jgi:hypothetical protein
MLDAIRNLILRFVVVSGSDRGPPPKATSIDGWSGEMLAIIKSCAGAATLIPALST